MNSGIKPVITEFRRYAYLMDGQNIPRYYDKNSGFVWQHDDPSTAITANESGAGSMSGVVKYFYTEANITAGDGDIHSAHETNPSPIYTTGTLSNNKVVLTLPGTADNAGFTNLKIYATLEDGSVYYYIGNVEIGTTSFEDDGLTRDTNYPFGKLETNADGTQTQTYLNYNAPWNRYFIATKNRILAFGIREYSTGVVSVNDGATAVTGNSTHWTTNMVGMTIYFNDESRGYIISAVNSGTSITLSSNYEGGADLSSVGYLITGDKQIIKYSAEHPTTGKPLPWSFPTDFYLRINSEDPTELSGGGVINDQPCIFKNYSHYLLSESHDDEFDYRESNTKIGTKSHFSIAPIPETGSLLFLSPQGELWQTFGEYAKFLGPDLKKEADGIELSRLEYCEGVWCEYIRAYMMIYTSSGETENDRILVYFWDWKEWVTWPIRANCIAIVKSTEDGDDVKKPWIGTVGGFVYKLLTGNNLGGSSTGTLTGTITSAGAASITDSSADFYDEDDGLKDCYVQLYNSSGAFVEEQKISVNSDTVITVDTNWTNTPQVGWTYEIGGIRWHWTSKIFDLTRYPSETIRKVMLNFAKTASSTEVNIECYFAESTEMPTSASTTKTFDLSKDYVNPLSLRNNRQRYFQFKISGHGVADPVTINSIVFYIQEHFR